LRSRPRSRSEARGTLDPRGRERPAKPRARTILTMSIARRAILFGRCASIRATYDPLSAFADPQRRSRGETAENGLENERIDGKNGKGRSPFSRSLTRSGAHKGEKTPRAASRQYARPRARISFRRAGMEPPRPVLRIGLVHPHPFAVRGWAPRGAQAKGRENGTQ
jgi:hypothetical protein